MQDEQRTEQSAPQPSLEPQATPAPTREPVVQSAADVEKAKGTAWLSYVGILWLIPLLTLKDNSFAKWHAKQGIALTICWVAVGIVGAIPFIGWFIIWPIGIILLLVFSIIGLIKSLGGHYWKCPMGIAKLAGVFKF